MGKPAAQLPQAGSESHDHHRDRDQATELQHSASQSAMRDIARERLWVRDERRGAHLGD
jgi:hypothetical protein